jgi:hypothetical protein
MGVRGRLWAVSMVGALSLAGLLAWSGPASADGSGLPAPTAGPLTAHAGDTVTISGTGCFRPRSDAVEVALLDGTAQVSHGVVEAKDIDTTDGSWSAKLAIPPGTPPGKYTVASTCDNYYSKLGANYPALVLEVQASRLPGLSLSVGLVASGGNLDVNGVNFMPGEKVDVLLHSTPILLATLPASPTGTVAGTVTVPKGTPPGNHTIELVGETSGNTATAPLTVTAPPGNTQLAATGIPSVLVTDGGVLLVSGLIVLLISWQWSLAADRAAASRRRQRPRYRPEPHTRWNY